MIKKKSLLKMLRMMTTMRAGHMQSPHLPENSGQGFLGGGEGEGGGGVGGEGGGGGQGGKPMEKDLFMIIDHATVLSSNKKWNQGRRENENVKAEERLAFPSD